MELEDNKRRRRISEDEEARAPDGRVTAPALDDHHGAGHRHASGRDAGAPLRRHRLEAAAHHAAEARRPRAEDAPRTDRHRAAAGSTRMAAARSAGDARSRRRAGVQRRGWRTAEPFKTGWVMAVLKAHGIEPRWRRAATRTSHADVPARFRDINLHWHDLRHEYASRLVERGVPLAQVRDLLGHASITTTERYDNQRLEALQAPSNGSKEARRSIRRSKPRTKFQESFKIRPNRASPSAKTPPRNPQKSLTACGLESWYRYGDSNPGPVAENHVS